MILGLIDEKLPERDILTVKPTGTLKAIGMGIMRSEADIGAAATATLTGLTSYISPELAEPIYRLHEEVVKPAKKYWTPEPGSVSGAGEFLSGVAGIVPYLFLGPEVMIGTSMMNIADELSEQGADKKAIIESAIIRGLSTAAMTKIPPAGKTLGRTFGLAAINPVFGMAERKAIQEILKAEGYKDIAGQYDPFDPYAMGIDAFIGAMFGGYSHLLKASAKRIARRTFETEKAKAIEDITGAIESPSYHEMLKRMPVELEDAIGVLRQHQKLIKDTMFNPENPRAVRMHLDAMTKALNDLAQDKPVDVSEQVREIQRPRVYPESYTIDQLRQDLLVQGMPEEQFSAYEGMLRANAKIAGEDFDVYVGKRFAGVEDGKRLSEELLYQEMKPQKGAGDISAKKPSTPEAENDNITAAKKALSKRVRGEKLLDNEDLIDELSGTGAVINADGTVDVYHRTTPEQKSAIESSGKMIGLEDGLFFSTKEAGQAKGYGDAVIKLRIPIEKLELDDIFNNEAHLRLPVKPNEKIDVSRYLETDPSRPAEDAGLLSSEEPTLEQSITQYGQKRVKGAVSFLEDGRAVIHAFEGFDFSTLVHETAHIFRRHLPLDDLKILESEYKITDGKWSREHEENFAKGFERYLAEGKAPKPELQGVFDKFKKWILEIYRNIVGDDVWNVKLSPNIRKVMDRLFIEAEIPLKKTDLPETIEARKIAEAEGKELEAERKRQAEENDLPKMDIYEFAEKAGKPLTEEIKQKVAEAKVRAAEARAKEAVEKPAMPLTAEEGLKYLKENPFLADYVLGNKSLYPKEVIAEAERITGTKAQGTEEEGYDIKHHTEWLRSYIGESEGPSKVYNPETGEVVGRLGSGYPLWFQNKGYTKKEVMNIALKFMGGKKLTEKQQGILEDLIKSSKTEYGMMYVTDMPEARMVEEIMAEKDIPIVERDAMNNEKIGSMKKRLDEAKLQLRKTISLEDAYGQISKCVR